VEVEQPPAAAYRGPQVAEIIEPERRRDVVPAGRQLDHAAAAGKREAAPVAPLDRLLDAWDRPRGEERDRPCRVVWLAQRETHRQPVGRRNGARALDGAGSQLARRAAVHLPDRRVELAHAVEAGRQRERTDRKLARLEQRPRSPRTLGAG